MPDRSTCAVALLLAVALLPACHHGKTETTPPSDTTAPEVIEWLLGEQVRGPKTRNRGHVGVVIYDLSTAEPTATVLPGSCAPDLVRLIPTPERSGMRFALDEAGTLMRYTGTGWSPVLMPETLGTLDELLAFSTTTSDLELLVRQASEQRQLTLLTFEGDQITRVTPVELGTFYDRRETLERYDSGRCLDGTRDCLHLVGVDGQLILMREPVLYDNRVEVSLALGEGTRDIRYADTAGTKIDVLTTDACAPADAPAPSTDPDPAAQTEASPEPEAAP